MNEFSVIIAYLFQSILGKILLKSFNFITMPLLTFYISPMEMGIYQLLFGGMGIFVEVATMGFRQYLVVEYFKKPLLYSRLSLVGTNLWVYLRITSLFFVLMFFVLGWRIETSYLLICLIAVFHSYLNIFNELYLTVTQFQMQFFRYNLISLTFGGLQVIGVILGVVLLKMQLMGLLLALFVVELMQLFYSILSSKKALKLTIKIKKRQSIGFEKVIKNLKNSVIFIPSTISFWLLINIDQWMLGGMVGLDSVGLYAFAGKFPLLFDYLVSSSLILVYTPFLYKQLQSNFIKAGWSNVVLSFVVLILSPLVYYLVLKSVGFIELIVSANYYAALKYIPVLVLVACIKLATHLLQLCLRFKGKVFFIVWSNIFIVGVNLILNYFWIPKYGIQGCLMATLSSFVIMYVMNLFLHLLLIRYSFSERIEQNV